MNRIPRCCVNSWPTLLTACLSASCVLLLALPAASAASASVVAPGAKPVLLADTFSFTEGPIADTQGNIYFTDQPKNKIYKWSTDGSLSVFMDNAGRANGLYIDRSGNLYACADEHNELWMIDPSRRVTVLVKEFEGKRLNGPNDLWIDPRGGIYFTDPYYQRDYWDHKSMEQDGQHVYYLTPDRGKLLRVATGFQKPNGIIGSPDGQRLYVADIQAGRTYVFSIQPDGTLADRKLFAELGSDGMTMDEEENIYVTGKGVTVFNPSGQQIDFIELPGKSPANLTFGGPDRKTLFITAREALFSLQMRVRGAQ